ncbi:MAG: type III-A CRISPR-associated RAMP protein Csm5 [Coriobacteriia bacterium]|nr:type III-A CRISPR-associated RAMP protein Csm5 [Coriobacteriia bacterium]
MVRKLRLRVKTVGLVHIGNSQQYGKHDYFADKGKIAVLDIKRFTKSLNPEQLQRYCDFLQGDKGGGGLQGFLSKNEDLRKVAKNCIAYRVDTPLFRARRGEIKYYDVWQFVKDPYGKPYIPGSSVKGMLRTAILLNLVLQNREEYRSRFDLSYAVSGRRGADGEIVKYAFRDRVAGKFDAVSDAMRYVSVSDSEPLKVEDLVFAKKYDQFSKKDLARHKPDMGNLSDFDGNSLNVYWECLRPGTEIVVDVSVDEEKLKERLSGLEFDAEGIESLLKRSFDFYSDSFLRHFDCEEASAEATKDDGQCGYVIASGPFAGRRCSNAAVEGSGYCRLHKDAAGEKGVTEETPCYLGGGVDFASKTTVGALYENEQERAAVVSRILYGHFPTKVAHGTNQNLCQEIRREGFEPKMQSFGGRGRVKKTKEDHRHWMDSQLGVSPHTLKWGDLGSERYLMGRCSVEVEEL